RQLAEGGNLRFRRVLLVPHLPEHRVAVDVGARRALPTAAEPGQPVAQVEKERLALLLAVVADIDTGFHLFGNHPGERRFAGGCERGRVDRFTTGAAYVETDELRRPWQAAGVGRENAIVAAQHGSSDKLFRYWSIARFAAKSTKTSDSGPCTNVEASMSRKFSCMFPICLLEALKIQRIEHDLPFRLNQKQESCRRLA